MHISTLSCLLFHSLSANVTNMSRLEYIFDKRKLLKTEFENLPNFNPANYFDNAAQAEQAIKGQFQVMMQNPNNQILKRCGLMLI